MYDQLVSTILRCSMRKQDTLRQSNLALSVVKCTCKSRSNHGLPHALNVAEYGDFRCTKHILLLRQLYECCITPLFLCSYCSRSRQERSFSGIMASGRQQRFACSNAVTKSNIIQQPEELLNFHFFADAHRLTLNLLEGRPPRCLLSLGER